MALRGVEVVELRVDDAEGLKKLPEEGEVDFESEVLSSSSSSSFLSSKSFESTVFFLGVEKSEDPPSVKESLSKN